MIRSSGKEYRNVSDRLIHRFERRRFRRRHPCVDRSRSDRRRLVGRDDAQRRRTRPAVDRRRRVPAGVDQGRAGTGPGRRAHRSPRLREGRSGRAWLDQLTQRVDPEDRAQRGRAAGSRRTPRPRFEFRAAAGPERHPPSGRRPGRHDRQPLRRRNDVARHRFPSRTHPRRADQPRHHLHDHRRRPRRGEGLADPAAGSGVSDPLHRRARGEGPRRRARGQQGCPPRRRGRHRRCQTRARDLGCSPTRAPSSGSGC